MILLVLYGESFRDLYNKQVDLFKRVCAYYLSDLSDDEIRELYATMPAGTFTQEKNDYFAFVEDKVKAYKATLGSAKLKKLWQDKTGSSSPENGRRSIKCRYSA